MSFFKSFAAYYSGAPQMKPTKTNILYYLNRTAAAAYLDVAQSCDGYLDATQNLTFQCNPSGLPREMSKECVACLRNANAGAEAQFEAQRETAKATGNYDVRANIDAQFLQFSEYIYECNTSCKTCDITRVSQDAFITFNISCRFTDEMLGQIQSLVSGKFKQTLYSNRDIAGSLVNAVAGSNADKTIADVSSKAASLITTNVLNQITSSIVINQQATFRSNGVAVFRGDQQEAVVDQVATLFGDNSTFDSLLSDTQWKAWETTWKEDTTLNSVGQVFIKTIDSFQSMISNTIAAVMFGLMIVLTLAVVVFTIYLIVAYAQARKRERKE